MARTRRAYLTVVGTATAATGFAGCLGESAGPSGSPDPGVDDAELLLNWKPSGLHVPYYVAAEQGFYDEQGLELRSIESGQGSDFSAQQVGLGNVDFAITSGDQLLNVNGEGLDARCVGVVMQQNPVVLFSSREQFGGELTEPAALEGTTVGSGPGMVRTMVQAYLGHHDLRDSIEYVDTGFDTVQRLLSGEIDVAGGVFGDAVDARQQGATIDVLSVGEAIPAYGHVVATSASFANDNPDAVRAFLRGTARGAAWGTENVESSIDALVDRVPELGEVRANQREKWETLSETYMLSETVRAEGWGWSDGEVWQSTHDTLREGGFLESDVDVDAAWTNEYLDTEYEYIGSYADRIDQ